MTHHPKIGGLYRITRGSDRRKGLTGRVLGINHKDHTCTIVLDEGSAAAIGFTNGTGTVHWSSLRGANDLEQVTPDKAFAMGSS